MVRKGGKKSGKEMIFARSSSNKSKKGVKKMSSKLMKALRDERGITALETAIILIAFVVVAAVFAFTILSAGAFTTEKSKEAVYAGLEEVRGSLEIRGSVIANAATTGITGTVGSLVFSLANVAGGSPVDFSTTNRVVILEYRDSDQRIEISDWTVDWMGYNDSDTLLEERELAEVTVPISSNLSTQLSTNKTFVIEVKPPRGSVLPLERTTPANLDLVNDLK
jgi:flagellin FlaB